MARFTEGGPQLALEISSDFISIHFGVALGDLENKESKALKTTYLLATFAPVLVNWYIGDW
ncbi:MAG: hypothetical protein H7246_20575 [Phycisphaerae bacterium]|nr:hypothetical protein [Saprospiraceae bacterium]